MANVEYDSGDSFHDGGFIINFEDDSTFTMDELEKALEDWRLDDELLIDFEADETFYQGKS